MDNGNSLINNEKLFSSEEEKWKRLRITSSELATNFMMCLFCFFIQFSYIFYIIKSFSQVNFLVGDLQLNITRFMSAISIHAILINESYQSINLMKFTITHDLKEGRKRNFCIGLC